MPARRRRSVVSNHHEESPKNKRGGITILQALIGKLQGNTLLGVHGMGLLGRDGEKGGIEAGDIRGHEVAALRVERATVLRVGVVEGVNVEPIGGPFAVGILAGRDHVPELVRVGSITWKAAGNANNGNGHGAVLGKDGRDVSVIRRHDVILVQLW